MKRIKIVLFAMIICCSMLLGMACNKNQTADTEETKEEELVISDTAIRYEFPSDNILQYKGVIIDKDFIIYVFGRNSELVRDLLKKRDDNMRVCTEYYDSSKRKLADNWKVIQVTDGYYLVIYSDTQTMDFENGIGVSNMLTDDGSLEYNMYNYDGTSYIIRGIEEPGLRIFRPVEDITDQWQSYEDGEWSVVRVQYFDTLD
ncbi:MAG: hypothetical protein IKS98_12765 [Lachnospiraceae bacterium]|nr:hypothetical protein [Lachnospiraceae bacterium]